MNDNINERLSTEQSWLLTRKENYHELMQGNTVYKRESERNAKLAREHQFQLRKEEEAAARKAEKKKSMKLKNPLKLSPRHSGKS